MNFIKKLFNRKAENADKLEPMVDKFEPVYETTYTVGWEIYNKDGCIQTRKYDNVSSENRNDITKLVEAEANEMHDILNKAAKEETEFVNLQGNILRLSDVCKICMVNRPTPK